MIATTVRFAIVDVAALVQALDDHAELERGSAEDGEVWQWSGPNREGKPTVFGNIVRQGDRLVLEPQSVERAARGSRRWAASACSTASPRTRTCGAPFRTASARTT